MAQGETYLYDMIIAGAGPGGNMAALELARQGFKVGVADWRTHIGDKLCTGIIGRDCADLVPPDAAHIYRAARSATIVAPSGRGFRVERKRPQAYVVNRAAYVNGVARQAQAAGAEYILGRRVSGIRIAADGARVEVGGAGGSSYQCKMVIIAAGFNSPLLRMAGLRENGAGEYMTGCQAEVSVAGVGETEVYVGSEVAPDSFGWLVPLSKSRALAGIARRRRVKGQLNGFIDRLRASGKVTDVACKPRAWGIPMRPLAKTYGDRVMAIGDAAGFAKPTSGGGIYYAFISGRMAATTAREAFDAGDFTARRLQAYEKRWKPVLSKELRAGYYARMLFETLNDSQIERLMEEFLREDVLADLVGNEDLAFDWHSRIIMAVLRYADIGRVLRALGPAAAPFAARLLQAHR